MVTAENIPTAEETESEYTSGGITTENKELMQQARDYAPPALAIIASFLSWASIQGPIVGSISVSGMDTDFGILLSFFALVGIASVYKGWDRGRLVAGGAALLTTVAGYLYLQSVFSDARADMAGNMFAGAIQMGFGIGIHLALLASVAMLYIGYTEYKKHSTLEI